MKTNLHSVHFIAVLIAITTTVVTQTMHAHDIVFTENSSNSLTVIFDMTSLPASDIKFNGSDNWTVTLPQSVTPDATLAFYGWFEPGGNINDLNVLTWISGTQLSIVSDTGFPAGNGFLTPDGTTLHAPDGTSYTFHDLGDTPASAPDSGSTFALLSLALAALFGISCFRSIRLA